MDTVILLALRKILEPYVPENRLTGVINDIGDVLLIPDDEELTLDQIMELAGLHGYKLVEE